MAVAIVSSENSLQSLIGTLRDEFKSHHYLKVNIKSGKDRSTDQNSISHAWYEQLARELKDEDALGWKSFCKLNFGVPILRAEDAEFRAVYDEAIKPLSYEKKIKVMAYFPVTSIMTKSQLSKYLETMRTHFIGANVLLEFPE